MDLRPLTGVLRGVNGAPLVGQVVFDLLEPFMTGEAVYPAGQLIVTTADTGALPDGTALAAPGSGTVPYRITTPDGLKYYSNLSAGPEIDIMTLLTLATSEVDQDAVQTLLDAYNKLKIVNKTAPYTIQVTDEFIRCSGTFTVTLPTAVASGAIYVIKNTGAGTITLAGAGAETIDGVLTQTLYPLDCIAVFDAANGAWDVF